VDGTLGGGGHTRLLADAVGPDGLVIASDRDPAAIDRGARELAGLPVRFAQANYCDLPEVLDALSIDAVDARASMRGWHVGRWLLVLDRSDSLLAIDTWTGRVDPNAFAASAVLAHSPIRQIAVGEGWIAAVRDSYADYFSLDGAHLGRDAPGSERAYVAAAASATRLFILDAGGAGSDPVPLRFPILLHDLDVSHGGLESAPPLVVRSLGQRSRDLVVSDGIVAAGNGSVVQAVEFSAVSAPAGR
jgi:hypothetical protein